MTKPDSSQQKYPAKGQKELTETQEIQFKPKKKLFGFFFLCRWSNAGTGWLETVVSIHGLSNLLWLTLL